MKVRPDDELSPEELWERACYRAGTQGLINVLVMVGILFVILILAGVIGDWLG